MSAHTKEPWVAVEGIIYPSNGREDGEDWIADLRSAGNCDANERRIVACVNACAGIPDDLLAENGPAYVLRKQRDELLAALKGMVEVAEFGLTLFGNTTPPDADGPLIQARAAIAKAEGRA